MNALRKKQIFFDFDGTIINQDTGFTFYKWLLLQSFWRSLGFIICLPILVFLRLLAFFTNAASIKKAGLNLVCIIATFNKQQRINQLIDSFIQTYTQKPIFFEEAINTIQKHLSQGDEVIIVSGCPDFLLNRLLEYTAIDGVILIGSTMRLSTMGLLIETHCYERNKLNCIRSNGLRINETDWLYTDSLSDWPLAKKVNTTFLVNAHFVTILIARFLSKRKIFLLEWIKPVKKSIIT